jgi:hypothetical protein
MRHFKQVCVPMSESDFNFLQSISDQFQLKKSEFIRLLIQGLKVGESAMTKQGAKVEVGGYGLEFSQEDLELFVKQLEPILEGLGKGVKVTPVKTRQKARVSRRKPVRTAA